MCGRLRGYQIGHTNGFGPYVKDQNNLDVVMDGVLISHGETRKHIWAYAAGYQKNQTNTAFDADICPCAYYRYSGTVPSFIGNDYYCDSGVESGPVGGTFYTTPLWTGEGCSLPNFCCSYSGMPWFCKTLPVPTTDYIEIRNCHNNPVGDEDVALQLIELYIH